MRPAGRRSAGRRRPGRPGRGGAARRRSAAARVRAQRLGERRGDDRGTTGTGPRRRPGTAPAGAPCVGARDAALAVRRERVAAAAARVGTQQLHRVGALGAPGPEQAAAAGPAACRRREGGRPRGRTGCGSAAAGPPSAPGTPSRRRRRQGPGAPAGCRARAAAGRRPRPSAGPAGRRGARASSRRLWHRSMPPTNATSRSGRPVAQHDDLLVVGAQRADPHVQQALAAGVLDLLAEVTVLGRAEAQPVEVRAPHQPPHDDAPRRRGGERR